MLLELAYVGNYSDKLLNDGSTQNTVLDDLNSLPVGALFGPQIAPASRNDLSFTGCTAAGAYHGVFGPASGDTNCSVGSLSQGYVDSYKRFPLYNRVFVPEHNTYSNYNGLQVGLTRQTGKAHYNVNYTFSKALGIQGIGGAATYSYPADPFNYDNDYSSMPFDRRHIFNASYSYALGNIVKKRFVGQVTNGWEVSGIVNYQSGPNLPSIINSNFGITGTVQVPVGAVAAIGNNVSTCTTTSGTGTCSVSVSSTNILGTPNVNLQSRLTGNPSQTTGSNQFVNGSAFSLPALGTNGAYRLPFLPGPGFFNTDITAAKSFRVTEGSSIQLRAAAFNFINHANNSFTQVNTANYTINYSQTTAATDLNQALLGANASSNPQFGYAPLKEGRRIMELALRYDF
ncbi:MAG: hypothetical protein INR62_12980 [Rhodospirillales bacterium]|nr:hypothetical protein [Acetobacter sp.]